MIRWSKVMLQTARQIGTVGRVVFVRISTFVLEPLPTASNSDSARIRTDSSTAYETSRGPKPEASSELVP